MSGNLINFPEARVATEDAAVAPPNEHQRAKSEFLHGLTVLTTAALRTGLSEGYVAETLRGVADRFDNKGVK